MREHNRTTEEKIAQLLRESDALTCINGIDVFVESGGIDLWENEEFYRIEREYGKSPDEMLSAGVYNAKKAKFFDFYQKEILAPKLTPAPAYSTLKQLQRLGKLKTVVTVNISGLEFRSGLRNVLELNGSMYANECPTCKKSFTMDYVENAHGMPLCPDCKSALRPGIRLSGERVRNDLMTEACNACHAADVLLVLGTNLNEPDVRYCTGHYNGDKMILISHEEHHMDKYADYVMYGNISEILSSVAKQI